MISTKRAIAESIILGVVLTAVSYLIGFLAGWITEVNWLEVFAVFTSYGSTWLCVRQKRFNYVYAVFSTAAYAWLFYQLDLYASMIVNIYLVPITIYGFFRWRKDTNTLPVRHVELKWVPIYLIGTVAVYIGAVYAITAVGGAFAPVDSAILVGTILAQFLLDNKKIETWIIWVIVNVAAIYVYFSSGIFLAGVQYVLFLANTVYAYIEWRKTLDRRVVNPRTGERQYASTITPEGKHRRSSSDMRVTPVDNPLDVREDGTIREGDPAWDFMMEVMNSEEGKIMNQQPDGTWKEQK